MKVRYKMTPVINLPFSVIHNVMMYQGFSKTRFNEHFAYRAKFNDTSTKRSYRLMIPAQEHDNKFCCLMIADAVFEETGSIPPEVVEAVKSKLSEVNAYLQDEREKEIRKDTERLDHSGRMSPNLEEMIRLGKEMATMKTNQEVLESGMVPDPAQ